MTLLSSKIREMQLILSNRFVNVIFIINYIFSNCMHLTNVMQLQGRDIFVLMTEEAKPICLGLSKGK